MALTLTLQEDELMGVGIRDAELDLRYKSTKDNAALTVVAALQLKDDVTKLMDRYGLKSIDGSRR